MNVVIRGTRARLTDRELLGVGGEGRVYAWRDLAVKIYHPIPSTGLAPVELSLARANRALALEKVASFPGPMRCEVAAPLDVVTDVRGEGVGFTMRAVRGGTEVMRLGQRKWRDGTYSSANVIALFKRIHDTVRWLHARGIVVGDFNDANVLFHGDAPTFIDCDSMQFGRFACQVAHERFLDPRLYATNLAARPAFSEATDWYAFTVMLFSSLLYVHPYGGSHKTFPTLLRRAEARHSILRPDVTYPKAAVHFRVLPDDLLGWAEAVFDRDARVAFPEQLLAMTWSRCSCGLEHARRACPACAAPTPRASLTSGRCRATIVRRTRGTVLAASAHGGLRYLVFENGSVAREDGSMVRGGPLSPGTRFVISGARTWIAEGERLSSADGGALVARGSAAAFRDGTAFDANSTSAFALVGDSLIELERGRRVCQALEGQTWFRVGEQLGFGFYQAGELTQYFVFRTDRGGTREVVLPRAGGRLADCAAYFDGDLVLFALAVDKDGRRTHALHLVSGDGTVIASASGSPDEQPMLAAIGGKCLAYGAIVCATEDGLLLVRADAKTRALVPEKLFVDTKPFVSAASELLPGPGGSVYVVDANEITQLCLG